MALGDFPDGEGGLRVEASARVVVEVDTHGRLGKVDGRFPHWVAPYSSGDRYSVIYYVTAGKVDELGPAVFSVPTTVASSVGRGVHRLKE